MTWCPRTCSALRRESSGTYSHCDDDMCVCLIAAGVDGIPRLLGVGHSALMILDSRRAFRVAAQDLAIVFAKQHMQVSGLIPPPTPAASVSKSIRPKALVVAQLHRRQHSRQPWRRAPPTRSKATSSQCGGKQVPATKTQPAKPNMPIKVPSHVPGYNAPPALVAVFTCLDTMAPDPEPPPPNQLQHRPRHPQSLQAQAQDFFDMHVPDYVNAPPQTVPPLPPARARQLWKRTLTRSRSPDDAPALTAALAPADDPRPEPNPRQPPCGCPRPAATGWRPAPPPSFPPPHSGGPPRPVRVAAGRAGLCLDTKGVPAESTGSPRATPMQPRRDHAAVCFGRCSHSHGLRRGAPHPNPPSSPKPRCIKCLSPRLSSLSMSSPSDGKGFASVSRRHVCCRFTRFASSRASRPHTSRSSLCCRDTRRTKGTSPPSRNDQPQVGTSAVALAAADPVNAEHAVRDVRDNVYARSARALLDARWTTWRLGNVSDTVSRGDLRHVRAEGWALVQRDWGALFPELLRVRALGLPGCFNGDSHRLASIAFETFSIRMRRVRPVAFRCLPLRIQKCSVLRESEMSCSATCCTE